MRLVARNVRVRLVGNPVLVDFDLGAAPGELVAIVGPNGSGKTTALRVLAGLLPPDHGQVLLGDRALGDWPARERARHLACLFQEQSVAFDFTVGELVALGSPTHRGNGEQVREVLGLVGLSPLVGRAWSTLSGGERQRSHLARCLASGADVLLLDEPTNHLDLAARARLLGILRNQTDRGVAIVLTTHDLETASAADRVVMLDRGRVEAVGSPRDVLRPSTVLRTFGVRVRPVPDPTGGPPFLRLVPEAPSPAPPGTGSPTPLQQRGDTP